MFLGISVTQFLFTVAVVVIVLCAFRLGARVGGDRREAALRAEARRRARRRSAGVRSAPRHEQQVEEMVECRVCGAYVVASGARGCGRAECPYAR